MKTLKKWPKALAEKSFKRRIYSYWQFWLIVLLMCVGTYEVVKKVWIWGELSDSRMQAQEMQDFAEAHNAYYDERLERYKSDTYGGSTPEETLRLFVEAMEARDVELAAKYLGTDERSGFVKEFNQVIKEGRGADIDDLPNLLNVGSIITVKDDGHTKVKVILPDGSLGFMIWAEYNDYTKIWKLKNW